MCLVLVVASERHAVTLSRLVEPPRIAQPRLGLIELWLANPAGGITATICVVRSTDVEVRASMPTVREATVADAPSIAAIGKVAFPAVHNEVVGTAFAAAVVEQTYSIEALTDCIMRCTEADEAVFLVAERDGGVVGFLHYSCEGPEPELHRIYVDPELKGGGIGGALMRELHARLDPGHSYVLLVAEANTGARAFYERHGLVMEGRVDGNRHYRDAMNLDLDAAPQPAAGLLLRFTKPGQ